MYENTWVTDEEARILKLTFVHIAMEGNAYVLQHPGSCTGMYWRIDPRGSSGGGKLSQLGGSCVCLTAYSWFFMGKLVSTRRHNAATAHELARHPEIDTLPYYRTCTCSECRLVVDCAAWASRTASTD